MITNTATYCQCENISVGSYGNQVMIPRPMHMKGRKEGTESDIICVDTCLANEIMKLWRKGIITTGCCCGHNKVPGYIGVILEDVLRMKVMGYQLVNDDERGVSFRPKSTEAKQGR